MDGRPVDAALWVLCLYSMNSKHSSTLWWEKICSIRVNRISKVSRCLNRGSQHQPEGIFIERAYDVLSATTGSHRTPHTTAGRLVACRVSTGCGEQRPFCDFKHVYNGMKNIADDREWTTGANASSVRMTYAEAPHRFTHFESCERGVSFWMHSCGTKNCVFELFSAKIAFSLLIVCLFANCW